MELQKPNVRLLYAWWLQLFILTLAACAVVATILSLLTPLWHLVIGALLAAFSVMFAWYYPTKYRRISYAITDSLIIVNCGVIFTRTKYLYIKNIQFATMDTSLIDSFFKISTAYLRTAGATMRIHGLDDSGRLYVRKKLSPYYANSD